MTDEGASIDDESPGRRTDNEQLRALHRLATLVAEGVQPQDLFTVVAEEVARVLLASIVNIARYESDGAITHVASFTESGPIFNVGARWPLDGTSVAGLVHTSAEAARIEDYSALGGEIADAVRHQGIRSAVGAPIIVAGRLWGAVVMSSTEPDRLPADTEARLSDFTELLGLAIANTESREALERLADEQAALRQVATLVGQGLPPDDIFSAVIEEVAGLFGCGAGIMRFEHDPPGFVYVAVPKALDTPLRLRGNIESETAPAAVYRTGRPARRERQDWSSDGPLAATARHRGIVSAVANPIIVDNRLWGAMNLWSSDEPLPPNTEERLERFTALLVTAIANAESREALRLLAEEQAALRRVATLVAQGVPASKVFMAVTDEVAELFGEGLATIGRFDVDQPTITIVGIGTNVDWIEIGTRVALTDETPTGRVYATDRPARVDRADWSTAESPQGRIAHQMAIVSAVASPIIVEGRPWGAMSAMATTRPLPPDTETRLERFSELVAAAIANTESRTELAASRRRIVAASDDARRRIERNLHDGTQQRLVSLGLAVKAAQADVPLDLRNVRSELSKIAKELADAAAELQEISRGIHPVLLSQSGIGAALRMLGRRSPIPVTIDLAVDSRLPEPVEVAAYYVASEALANAAKHARATHISVSLTPRDEGVLLSIIDDGIGGADPTQGSGLVGLIDRVEALGGSIDIRSAPGGGTRITSELPLDPGSGAPLE